MADLRSLSIPEILAYCRNADGEGGSAVPPPAADAAPEPAAPEPTAAPASSGGSAKPADRGSMSVADMLAAARAEKSGAGAAPAESPEPAASAAAPAPPAKPVDRGSMSVADMLAAARAEKSGGGGGGASSPAAKPAAKKAAPKAKPAAGKATPAKPAKTGPMDTSSILAAARSGVSKPGPITKAEAAKRAKEDPAATAKSKEKPKAPPMPPKPEYAKPAKAKEQDDRRTFFAITLGSMLAIGWGSMTAAAGIASLVLARFFFPNLLVEPPSKFKVGFPGGFSPGTVDTKFKAQFGVWVVNAEYEGQQQIVALKSVCTHLGCTPNWLEAEQKFKCPCHGSGFYKEGINFEGPAPRPLERYAIRIADDGQVEIDKSKTYQEQLGQWGDPSSFVSV